jgi:hypothetical protein
MRWLLCNWLWDKCKIEKILVAGINVSLPILKCFSLSFFVNISFKGLSQYTFVSINHSLAKLTACVFSLAIVFRRK